MFFTSLQDQKFDIGHVTKYFESKRTSGDLAIYYELDKCEDISTRGIIDICLFSNRVTKFYEKPSLGETTSRNLRKLGQSTRKLQTIFGRPGHNGPPGPNRVKLELSG